MLRHTGQGSARRTNNVPSISITLVYFVELVFALLNCTDRYLIVVIPLIGILNIDSRCGNTPRVRGLIGFGAASVLR